MRVTLIALALVTSCLADDVHEPSKGSPDRKAIMDAIRSADFPKQDVVFVVNYLRVHNGWAWTDVSPQDRSGKPVAEEGTVLLHQRGGKWSTIDLSKIPEDPANPLGAEEASPGFIRNLLKVHPDIPTDIFPKHRK